MDWNGFELVGDYVEKRCSEFDMIPVERKEALRLLATQPGKYDGTGEAPARYTERCAQIAREMFYLFARV